MVSHTSDKNYLLKLPAELRNDIFRLVFVQDEPLSIVIWRGNPTSEQTRGCSPQPAISATSKQFRNEVLSIYYGEHAFVLTELALRSGGGYPRDLRLFDKWAIAAKNFGRFMTSIRITCGYPNSRQLQCTQEVCRREHGTREFYSEQFDLSATTEPDDDTVNARMKFKLTVSGRFAGTVGISPGDRPRDFYRTRKNIPVCVCIVELASRGRVHRDETLQLRGDVEDVGLLNGTLRAISTILNARTIEVCRSCGLLMLRT